MSGVNLGTWRIVILAGLIATGTVILSEGFTGRQVDTPAVTGTTGPTGGTTGPTETQTQEPPPPEGQIRGVSIAVFNGTEEIGFAADVTLTLEDAGYSIGQEAMDAPTTGVRKSTVYFRGGANAAQNEANAQLLADDQLPGAKVRRINPEFTDLVPADTDLVIVLGQDQAPA
jgi:hypothetical protein